MVSVKGEGPDLGLPGPQFPLAIPQEAWVARKTFPAERRWAVVGNKPGSHMLGLDSVPRIVGNHGRSACVWPPPLEICQSADFPFLFSSLLPSGVSHPLAVWAGKARGFLKSPGLSLPWPESQGESSNHYWSF